MGRQTPFTKVPTGDPDIDRLQDRLAEALRVLRQSPQALLNAKGSIVAATGQGAPVEHPVGADGLALVARSTATNGIAYEAPAPGGAAGGVLAGTYPSPAFAAQAAGSVLLWDAAGNPLIYGPGAAGQVLTAQGGAVPPQWQDPAAGQGQTDFAKVRRWGAAYPARTPAGLDASPAISVFGMQAPTQVGTIHNNTTFNSRGAVYLQTVAAIGSNAGLSGPFTETRTGYAGKFSLLTTVDPSNNFVKTRFWAGLSSASMIGLAPGSGASAIVFAVIGYDTVVSPNWKLMTGDGTNYSTTDLGIAVANALNFTLLVLDWTTQATPTATIFTSPYDTNVFTQQVSLSKSSNVSSGAVDLGVHAQAQALENAAKVFYLHKLMLEQN